MHHMLIERLKFWIQEAALRAKFRLYERCPALFPHALDTDEEVETSPEDALQEIQMEQRYQEHLAAEPTIEPRRTMLFSSYYSEKKCNFLTKSYCKKQIVKGFHWATERGFTTVLVDYATPFGLLALETLLPLKIEESFNLYCVKSCFFGARKSFRLIPETGVEIAFLTSKSDYVFNQYLPEETIMKLFSHVGAICSEKGTAISAKWIPEYLRENW